MKPTFFRSADAFRQWLERHGGAKQELLVGFYKTDSGKTSITWRESVGEALCFGWIDGVRKRIDDVSYTIRFTPRKPTSTWSTVNIKRVALLTEQGRMTSLGVKAFERRRENRSGIYSHEQRPVKLTEPYANLLAKSRLAHKFFAKQAPSYQRAAIWWVISAKKEETRLKRARTLIELSGQGELIPQFTKWTGSRVRPVEE
jgi:uncharacterized protein YdeI (YjbR/CyaY-like superfamily)